MKNALLLILSVIVYLHSFAQTATCKPSKDTIYADEPLKVEYKFDDRNAGDFQFISTDNFEILNGPSTSSTFTSINGKTSSSTGYTYTFTALGNNNIQPPAGSFNLNGTRYDVNCPFVFVRKDSMPEGYLEQEAAKAVEDAYSIFGNFESIKRRFTPDIPDAYVQANVYLSSRKFKVGQQFTVTCKTNASGVEITKFSIAGKFFRLVPSDESNSNKIITTKDNKTAEITLVPLKPGKYRLTLFSIDTGLRVIGTEPLLIKVKR